MVILGLYRDNGKENGNYYIIIGYILGLYGVVIFLGWESLGGVGMSEFRT